MVRKKQIGDLRQEAPRQTYPLVVLAIGIARPAPRGAYRVAAIRSLANLAGGSVGLGIPGRGNVIPPPASPFKNSPPLEHHRSLVANSGVSGLPQQDPERDRRFADRITSHEHMAIREASGRGVISIQAVPLQSAERLNSGDAPSRSIGKPRTGLCLQASGVSNQDANRSVTILSKPVSQ